MVKLQHTVLLRRTQVKQWHLESIVGQAFGYYYVLTADTCTISNV